MYNWDTPVSACRARREMLELIAESQRRGILVTYMKPPFEQGYLEWQVLDGYEHEPCIRWMYSEERYYMLYTWYKMMHHVFQEHKPYDEPIEESEDNEFY